MTNGFALWMAKSNFEAMRVDFYKNLAAALEDKASLTSVIQKNAKRTKEARDVTAPIFALWDMRMEDRPFSIALEGTVPDGDIMILDAAEGSGNLPDGLRFLSKVITASVRMRTALRKSVTGFAFISIFLITTLVMFSFFGIGIIEDVVPLKDWPYIGLLLRDVARFVTGYGVWLAVGGIATMALYSWSLRNWFGPLRVKFDTYVPFYTIYRNFNGALFLVSLAALMRNNVSLTEALDRLSEKASPWLRWHINRISIGLDYHSDQPALAFATGIFSRRLTWLIEDYGERAEFADALGKIGLESVEKITEEVIEAAGKIKSLLLVVAGFMFAFIVVGTLATVYEAQNSLQNSMNAIPK